jgi:hypothetical protein
VVSTVSSPTPEAHEGKIKALADAYDSSEYRTSKPLALENR